MAYRPAVGQKYARLRAEQQAMLAAAGKALAEDMSQENQEHLAGAAAAVNAGRLNCRNIADAGHPALAGALESMAARSKRSALDDRPSRSCGKDIGEWRQLEKIMEQAMQLQLAQLKNLRVRNASADEESQCSLLDRAGASSACPADEVGKTCRFMSKLASRQDEAEWLRKLSKTQLLMPIMLVQGGTFFQRLHSIESKLDADRRTVATLYRKIHEAAADSNGISVI
ncbi:CPK2 [Symbiodinium sp. CCMP2592]|nr:CPK2 [Symbiodinium sp. CCMP2592]